MDENDKKFIRDMFTEYSLQFDRKLDERTEDFKQHVSSVYESFDHKLALLAEGHASLADKIDGIEILLDKIDTRLDRVETSLAAHRADTEAHQGLYRVKEG